MGNRKERLEKISRVRERGQFTVPLELREALAWPKGEVLVRVTPLLQEDGFKVERIPVPQRGGPERKLGKKDWDEIWQSMKKISRSGRVVNLGEFLVKDREDH